MSSIMLGITTFNRPSYASKCLRAIRNHVADQCDAVLIHNDGSSPKYKAEYQRAYSKVPNLIVQESPVNEGVAASKNALLSAMLDAGADWLFITEDDVIVQTPEAISGYVAACDGSGLHALFYAHAGIANDHVIPEIDGSVTYWMHGSGAYACFSRKCLEDVGLYDINMRDIWNDIELPLRLAQAGYTGGAYRFADATGSEEWLSEIPGCVKNSSVLKRSDWTQDNIRTGLQYWHDRKAETFVTLFGPGTLLEEYANNLLAH